MNDDLRTEVFYDQKSRRALLKIEEREGTDAIGGGPCALVTHAKKSITDQDPKTINKKIEQFLHEDGDAKED